MYNKVQQILQEMRYKGITKYINICYHQLKISKHITFSWFCKHKNYNRKLLKYKRKYLNIIFQANIFFSKWKT